MQFKQVVICLSSLRVIDFYYNSIFFLFHFILEYLLKSDIFNFLDNLCKSEECLQLNGHSMEKVMLVTNVA